MSVRSATEDARAVADSPLLAGRELMDNREPRLTARSAPDGLTDELADLRELTGRGAPVPGGRPNAEPGDGRASGVAQRRRLDSYTAGFGS